MSNSKTRKAQLFHIYAYREGINYDFVLANPFSRRHSFSLYFFLNNLHWIINMNNNHNDLERCMPDGPGTLSLCYAKSWVRECAQLIKRKCIANRTKDLVATRFFSIFKKMHSFIIWSYRKLNSYCCRLMIYSETISLE